jgi:hypothetical protein
MNTFQPSSKSIQDFFYIPFTYPNFEYPFQSAAQNIEHQTLNIKSYLSDTKSGMHFFTNALATDSSEDVRPCADF